MNFLSKLKAAFFGEESVKPKVKVGQVWGYCYREGNPFIPPAYRKATVLEIRDGWVEFKDEAFADKGVCSISKFTRIYDELLEEKNE
jgi:hypothetical protein